MIRLLSCGSMVIAVALAGSAPAKADDAADVAAIVAAQVRSQGHACTEPVQATKDEAASKPDLPVYVLTCADASYRVRLVPDQGADISAIP
jgi:hypothetical protein